MEANANVVHMREDARRDVDGDVSMVEPSSSEEYVSTIEFH